jgi:hypothetical protein
MRTAAIIATMVVLLSSLGATAQDGQKPNPPSSSEQADAEKLIKDIFKDDYAKRTPADRQALARKMLSQALQSKDDPKSQFVLLREARDLASLAGDVQTALSAVDEMAKAFSVDSAAMRSTVLTNAAKTAKTPDDFKGLASMSLKMIDSLLLADDYDGAEKLAATASQNAKRSQDLPTINRAAAKSKEIAELRARYDKLKKAKETLAANPDDGPSNLLLGKFQCVTKGNWSAGLPLLAKCSDTALQALSAKELENPAQPADQVAVGDGWWDLSEKEPAPGKDNLKEHAVSWYSKAAAKVTGLSKSKIEKRVAEFGQQKLARGTWVDATDPKYFGEKGKPGDPIELSAKPGYYENRRMSTMPKGDFDGISVRITVDTAKEVRAWLVYEARTFTCFLDTARSTFVHAHDDGKSWIHDLDAPWTKREESVITVLLTDGAFVVYLDGKEMTRAKTLKTTLSSPMLEVRDGAAKFDKIQLRRLE